MSSQSQAETLEDAGTLSDVAKVLLIDNYDSFVFNLARYLEELGVSTSVRRNNEISIAEIESHPPQAIILSPGPCTPNEAGICLELVRQLGPRIPILGVCLGHQAIGAAFGGNVIRSPHPMHGQASLVNHSGTGIFSACPSPLQVARYHSLIVDHQTLPDTLDVTARTEDGMIMAFSHREWPVHGVQFHPESILTQQGHLLLRNFLQLAGIRALLPLPPGDLPPPRNVADDFYQRGIDPSVSRPLPR